MLTRAQKKKKEEFNRKLKLYGKIFGGILFAVLGLVYLYSGAAVKFDYLGLAEEAVLDDPAQEEEIEEDDLSFDMM